MKLPHAAYLCLRKWSLQTSRKFWEVEKPISSFLETVGGSRAIRQLRVCLLPESQLQSSRQLMKDRPPGLGWKIQID